MELTRAALRGDCTAGAWERARSAGSHCTTRAVMVCPFHLLLVLVLNNCMHTALPAAPAQATAARHHRSAAATHAAAAGRGTQGPRVLFSLQSTCCCTREYWLTKLLQPVANVQAQLWQRIELEGKGTMRSGERCSSSSNLQTNVHVQHVKQS